MVGSLDDLAGIQASIQAPLLVIFLAPHPSLSGETQRREGETTTMVTHQTNCYAQVKVGNLVWDSNPDIHATVEVQKF